jgi:hypothetical protein
MATDTNALWWENNTIFKSSIIHDKSLTTGYPFVMFYNARGDRHRPGREEKMRKHYQRIWSKVIWIFK